MKNIMAYAIQDELELLIFDEIGSDPITGHGVSAEGVRDFLKSNRGNSVTARINSFGGDFFEALAIHNLILDHGNVSGIIEGIAFSAAAIIAMGCKTLAMRKESDFGIHQSWTMAAGNCKDLEDVRQWLDVVDQHQVDILSLRSGNSNEQITQWLDGVKDGTVWGAAKALELGFCDEVTTTAAAEAKIRQHAAALHQCRLRAEMQHITVPETIE